jgi:hypothetical protein
MDELHNPGAKMPRVKHRLVIISLLVLTAALFLLAIPSAAQTTIGTPSDIELTLTKIINDVTQTSIAIGTPIPPEIQTATMQAAQATRTAIAITREPFLLTPQTPNVIELTATRLIANYEQTRAAYVTPKPLKPGELDPIYFTATFVVQRATLTSAALATNPALVSTPFPTTCVMQLNDYNRDPEELSRQIQAALGAQADASNSFILVNIVTSGVTNFCGEFYPLETLYDVTLGVDDILDRPELIHLTEKILALLQNFPPQTSDGKVIRLQIWFRGNLYLYKYIDTGYANALAAYAEGLRGDELIEALGGILDGLS